MRCSDLSKKLALVLGVLMLVALLSGCGAPDRSAPPSAAAPTPAPMMAAPTAAPLASAPTAAPVVARGAAGASDRLYIRYGFNDDEERFSVIDSASGARERELPPGVASPDWTTLYTIEQDGGKTRVRALDVQTGQALRETSLDGGYVFPTVTLDELRGGLSPNGSWLALERAPGLALSKTQSQFVVLDTRFEKPPRRVDLDVDGPYHFDGINNSGASLYLVQYLTSPSLGAPKYQVRYYDLALGQLSPDVIVAKGESQVMQGTHQLSVNAPAGDWRFSLYLNNSYGPFIHALNLNDRFAICIDLPKDQKDDEAK